jgi:hypothetical protein
MENELNVKRYREIIDEVYNEYGKKYSGYEDIPIKEVFIIEIKNNQEFSKIWGLNIKERELSLTERRMMVTQEMYNQVYTGGGPETLSHQECDQWNISKKLITIKYKKEKIEVYI